MFCRWLICPNYDFLSCTLSMFFLAQMIVWKVLFKVIRKKNSKMAYLSFSFLVVYAFCLILWEQHSRTLFQVQTKSSKNFSGIKLQCSDWFLNTRQQKLTLLIFISLLFNFPYNSIALKYRWWCWWVLAGGEGSWSLFCFGLVAFFSQNIWWPFYEMITTFLYQTAPISYHHCFLFNSLNQYHTVIHSLILLHSTWSIIFHSPF